LPSPAILHATPSELRMAFGAHLRYVAALEHQVLERRLFRGKVVFRGTAAAEGDLEIEP
jgi:hypothetical protein